MYFVNIQIPFQMNIMLIAHPVRWKCFVWQWRSCQSLECCRFIEKISRRVIWRICLGSIASPICPAEKNRLCVLRWFSDWILGLPGIESANVLRHRIAFMNVWSIKSHGGSSIRTLFQRFWYLWLQMKYLKSAIAINKLNTERSYRPTIGSKWVCSYSRLKRGRHEAQPGGISASVFRQGIFSGCFITSICMVTCYWQMARKLNNIFVLAE